MVIAKRMYVFVAALFVFIAASTPVEAQFLGEVVCWWCVEQDGEHGFTLNGRGCGSEGEYPDNPDAAQCVRCGNTSQCHEGNMPGPCHIACGSAGDAVTALAEIQQALESDDITEVASALLMERNGVLAGVHPGGWPHRSSPSLRP